MHQRTYENRAINSTCILTWKWSPFVICQEREAEAKQCGVKKNSLVIMCRLLHDPPLPPLGFSQTCYVSAGLMQACSELKVESAFFFSLSTSAFFLFSISGSDSRQADERVFWEIWRWELIWLTQQGGHDRKKNWIETRVRGWMGVRGWFENSSLPRDQQLTSQCTHRQKQEDTHTHSHTHAYSSQLRSSLYE